MSAMGARRALRCLQSSLGRAFRVETIHFLLGKYFFSMLATTT